VELNSILEKVEQLLQINRLIQEGTEFEEELLVLTGNERWSRVSGKSERINNVCIKFMEVSRY
jgi:hypothetical protein